MNHVLFEKRKTMGKTFTTSKSPDRAQAHPDTLNNPIAAALPRALPSRVKGRMIIRIKNQLFFIFQRETDTRTLTSNSKLGAQAGNKKKETRIKGRDHMWYWMQASQ